jgi:hypothetical protein
LEGLKGKIVWKGEIVEEEEVLGKMMEGLVCGKERFVVLGLEGVLCSLLFRVWELIK